MIISYILKKLDVDSKEFILFSSVSILLFGLIFGLALGLVDGLVFGLVVGVALGLAVGLTAGLVRGLMLSSLLVLAVGLGSSLSNNLFPSWVWIIVLIVVEILFWLDKTPYKQKTNKYVFTIIRKGEALFEVGLVLGIIPYLVVLQKHWVEIGIALNEVFTFLIPIIGVVGFVVIIILLNSLKYKKEEK